MMEITITLPHTDLASRTTAAGVRYKVVTSISAGNLIIVDLRAVESIAYSYADELFGVLVATQGFEWLVNNVKIAHAKENVLRVIAESINRRLKETGQAIRRSA